MINSSGEKRLNIHEGPLSVAIVTPSFNQGRYIRATIDSVLSQGYPSLDYLIVDGGSTDGTGDVLAKYGERVRWISEKDRGQSDGINKGLQLTKGDVFAWINSDDTYTPGAIWSAAEYLRRHPEVDVVYGNANFMDPEGRVICPCAHIEPFDRGRLLNGSDFIVQPAAFMRRRAIEDVGGLDPSLHWAMDYDLWLKLARGHRFAHVPQVWANYRWLENSKTGTGSFERIAEVERVINRYGLSGLPTAFRLEKVRLLFLEGMEALKQGRPGGLFSAVAPVQRILLDRAVLKSLFSSKTWKIIYTGQILRRHACGADRNPACEEDIHTLTA